VIPEFPVVPEFPDVPAGAVFPPVFVPEFTGVVLLPEWARATATMMMTRSSTAPPTAPPTFEFWD